MIDDDGRVWLEWSRFASVLDARDEFGYEPCVYAQTDRDGVVVRVGKASMGLTPRYGGGNTGALDAAMHGSGNSFCVAPVPVELVDRVESTLIWTYRHTLDYNVVGRVRVATLDAGAVSNTTPAATLRAGSLSDPSLLASTPDANTTDPFIQEEAAKLDYDPQKIYDFLQTRSATTRMWLIARRSRHALEHGRQCARRVQSRRRVDAGLGNPGAVRPGYALAGTGTAAHQLDVST